MGEVARAADRAAVSGQEHSEATRSLKEAHAAALKRLRAEHANAYVFLCRPRPSLPHTHTHTHTITRALRHFRPPPRAHLVVFLPLETATPNCASAHPHPSPPMDVHLHGTRPSSPSLFVARGTPSSSVDPVHNDGGVVPAPPPPPHRKPLPPPPPPHYVTPTPSHTRLEAAVKSAQDEGALALDHLMVRHQQALRRTMAEVGVHTTLPTWGSLARTHG